MPLHADVACLLCGCLCDDLIVESAGDQILHAKHACPVAARTFTRLNTVRPLIASCHGAACPSEEAFAAAAELLRNSRAPLLSGLRLTDTDGHRSAIHLAEHLGAVIDTAGSPLTRASLLALQQAGASTCTLGEIRQRGDLIIYWGSDPLRTHPRHIERYSGNPASEFLPRGRADRTLVLIHSETSQTERAADLTIRISPGTHADVVAALWQLVRNADWQPADERSLPLDALRDLARRIRSCRYGVIFTGEELAQGPTATQTIESLHRFVAELNGLTRFTIRAMGHSGAETALTWQTGFPCAVDFQQGFPRYQPGEFSTEELLLRKEVDSCIIVGSDSLEHLSPAAMQVLRNLPTIVLDAPHQSCPLTAHVQFTTALPGVQMAGTAYRMDGVALPLQKLCESPYPSAGEVLTTLRELLAPTMAHPGPA